jgi:hypothetical protein
VADRRGAGEAEIDRDVIGLVDRAEDVLDAALDRLRRGVPSQMKTIVTNQVPRISIRPQFRSSIEMGIRQRLSRKRLSVEPLLRLPSVC